MYNNIKLEILKKRKEKSETNLVIEKDGEEDVWGERVFRLDENSKLLNPPPKNKIHDVIALISKKDKNKPLIVLEEKDKNNPELVKLVNKFNMEMEELNKELNEYVKLKNREEKHFYMGDTHSIQEKGLVIDLDNNNNKNAEKPEVYFLNNKIKELLKQIVNYSPNILEISPDDVFNIEEVENYLDPNVLNKTSLGRIQRKFYKINRKVQNELNSTNIDLTGERFPEQGGYQM